VPSLQPWCWWSIVTIEQQQRRTTSCCGDYKVFGCCGGSSKKKYVLSENDLAAVIMDYVFESWRTHNGKAKFGYLTMFMLKRKKRKGKRGNRGAKRKEFRIF
jgi:hypothetical protein